MNHDEPEEPRTEHLAQLGGLLAGFAHEIRNPLSTIGLNLQLVLEDFKGAESPRDRRTHKRLTVVQGEVKRLQTIVEGFLGFVRTPRPQRRAVELNSLLQTLVELATPEMRELGITLKFFPGPAVGSVELDPDQIRAVIVNLLRNAKEACHSGDEIIVSTRRTGEIVDTQVIDTGEGMEPAVVERAFTPYFSTKKGGTGLGLALARRIADEHGGTLTVSSELGRGTQFTLRLPAPAVRAELAEGERS
jgi:signal transduction histidine kinase